MPRKAPAEGRMAASAADRHFRSVVGAFGNDVQVHQEVGKGFGSGSLKVNGKIFAMITAKGHFVVKLSRTRIDDLVAGGMGKRFDPGHGRVMKEWLVVRSGPETWLQLAREARQFVGGRT